MQARSVWDMGQYGSELFVHHPESRVVCSAGDCPHVIAALKAVHMKIDYFQPGLAITLVEVGTASDEHVTV